MKLRVLRAQWLSLFTAGVVLLSLQSVGFAQTTTSITLDQAIDLALAHNHALKATRTMILQNQAQEITANLRTESKLRIRFPVHPYFFARAISRSTI